MKTYLFSYRKLLSWAALAGASVSTLQAQEPSSPRVTGQEKAAGAEVRINQVETSEFPKVTLFATILKDGVPVQGLTASDFRVREDEVDQEPITVVPKLTPLSVVLTLDTSGSMKKRLADAQAAAKSFLDTLEAQDKAQVIRFSRDVRTIFPLGSDRAAAGAAIDTTVARGDTALWDALYASLESLRPVAGRKAIVLLSDGIDDDGTGKPLSKKTVVDVLALARQVNVPIYAIGLGTELDEINLKTVATDSGALYLNAVDPAELKRLYDSIGKQLAGQYTIYYTSNLPSDGSEHRVQLRFGDMTGTKSFVPPARAIAATPKAAEPAAELPSWLPLYPESKPEGLSVVTDPQTGKRVGSFFFRTIDGIKQVQDFYEDKMTQVTWRVSRAPMQVWGKSDAEGRKFEVHVERRGDGFRARVTFEERKVRASAARGSTTDTSVTLPDWLPLYPGSKPEGVSVMIDPQSGKRVGSYFFRTSDEIEQVHDFYEDKMTQATWNVSRAPTQVWGKSDAEGRKFEVSPERRGDEVRARVTFEERTAKAPAAGTSATSAAAPAAPAATSAASGASAAPTWLPLYPGSKPEGLSVVTDPQTGNRVGSYFFRTPDEIEQVHDFYEDKMTQATWSVSRAPTQVWGSSEVEGRKFEVSPERRGDEVRARVTFEERTASSPAAGATKTGAPAASAASTASAAPGWLPLYPGSKPEGLSVVTDPQTGNRVGSYFFRTSDEIEQVHDFYEDKMTRATWSVSRAPTQVWGSSDAEGRKFEITPQRRGDDTRVRVNFEEKEQK